MGSITIVNLTDSTIQSAIANANNIHSGINGILPHAYYHHNATDGTGYDVWEKWYIPGFTEDFPSSDLAKVGWYIGGAFVTIAGIVATALSLGTATPAIAGAWAAFNTTIAAAGASGALTTAQMAGAVAGFVAAVGANASVASLAGGAIAGITGVGITIGSPVSDYLASSAKSAVPGPVWGQNNKILQFTGKIPLETHECQCDGRKMRLAAIPTTAGNKAATPPDYAGELTSERFDMMRRIGEIYQIKHRNGEYCDMTQGLVRLNLRGAGGKERMVSHAGAAIDISKIYKLWIVNPADRVYPSCLMAGEDEGDNRVYLRKVGKDQELSCCYWQFIPTRKGGADGKGGWLIVDRRYARFLYWSGSEILQYQSEEVGESGIKITPDGWAEWDKQHEPLKGMVWNLPPFAGSSAAGMIIEQPGTERICVTGRTDQGRAIYARPFGSHDVFQVWALGAMK